MRKSEYYGVNVPELGDRADITVVSQAIIDSENNQSGKVENMKATVSETIISLTSETRQDALLKYYNGLAVQFISPVNASAGSSYKIKIGSLTEQPYNNKVDIKVGDIVQAIYGSTGFVSANTPIPRSSSVSSNSETTVATSKAVKQANDNADGRVSKSGDKMTGTLYVPKDSGLIVGENSLDSTGKTYETRISSESGYSMIWRTSNTSTKASEFLGIRHDSEPIFRQDTKDGSGQWKDNVLYHSGNLQIVDNLTTADQSKVLSANMGKYLDENKPSKNKVETITNYWTFEGNTPFIKFKKTGEQSLPSDGYSALIGFGSSARPHELQIRNLYDDGTVNIDSTDLKTENKNITKAINEVYNNQLGNSGVSKIIYIQDAGEKTAGNGYVDKTTGRLYLCKTTNSDTSTTSNFVLATNIEIAKGRHSTKTILFDNPTGQGEGDITLSDNWENYDEFLVYGSGDKADYVGAYRFKKEDIEYSISKGQRHLIYTGIRDYWLARITTGSKTWVSGHDWENCTIFRIIGIKYGG